ncbi:MAG: hypothetical protein ACI3ZN_08090 [Candidatus Cryptobacteroides sp.]
MMKKLLMKTVHCIFTAFIGLAVVSCAEKEPTKPNEPEEPEEPTVEEGTKLSEVLKAEIGSTFEVPGLTVVGTNEQGVLLQQNEDRIYAFIGEAHDLTNGDVVTVSGTTATRNNLPQFSKGCTFEKTGHKEVVYPEAKAMSVSDIEAYMNTPSVTYATVTGTVLIAGNYVNLEMEGTSITGSLDYMSEDFKSKYSGHSLTINGWLFGSYKSFLYIIPVEVKDNGVSEEVVPEGAIYYNTFDQKLASQTFGDGGQWPYLDEFEGWKNQKGSGVANVEYEFQKMSARTNQSSKGSLSLYDGSGKNNLFFSTAPNYFTICKIDVPSEKLKLSFGAQRYSQGAANTFIKSDFEVRLSANGEVWSQALDYDFNGVEDEPGQWRLASADFTLPAGTKTLYIKFEAKLSSVNRIDDVLLVEGKGGQQIEFGKEDEIKLSTIAEVHNSPVDAKYRVEGTVICTHYKGFLVKDNTGIILCFKKKHGRSVGEKVMLTGATSVYGGLKQFGETTEVEVTGSETVTNPEPVEFKGADFTQYAAKPEIKYITYKGYLTATRDNYYQWHYNVAVDGTDVVGSVSYPNDDLNIRSFENKNVIVTGYAIGVSGSDTKYLNTMVTTLVVNE